MSLTAQDSLSSLETFPALGELGRDECERLLQRNMVGRLAFALHDQVGIVPVHYVYEDGWIYGRTEPGGKLVSILRNRRVAFEVDEQEGMFTWQSVVAQGPLYLISPGEGEQEEKTHAHALQVLRRIMPMTLAKGDPVPFRNQLFRIQVSEISGRRSSPGGKRVAPSSDPMRDDAARPDADALLRATVIGVLARAIPTATSRVRVDAFDGVVVLSGVAETREERSLIERQVLDVENVKAVVQQLDTAFPAHDQPEPVDIARAAVSALETLDPRDRNDVRVVVENDWLRAQGTVKNGVQHDEALRCLRTVKGTRGVIDRIHIAGGLA